MLNNNIINNIMVLKKNTRRKKNKTKRGGKKINSRSRKRSNFIQYGGDTESDRAELAKLKAQIAELKLETRTWSGTQHPSRLPWNRTMQ